MTQLTLIGSIAMLIAAPAIAQPSISTCKNNGYDDLEQCADDAFDDGFDLWDAGSDYPHCPPGTYFNSDCWDDLFDALMDEITEPGGAYDTYVDCIDNATTCQAVQDCVEDGCAALQDAVDALLDPSVCCDNITAAMIVPRLDNSSSKLAKILLVTDHNGIFDGMSHAELIAAIDG